MTLLRSTLLRRFALLTGVVLVGTYAVTTLRGPHGIPALLEKRREIRELQEENESLAKQIQRKRERMQRLQDNQSEQELEIRRRTGQVQEGDTLFVVPEKK